MARSISVQELISILPFEKEVKADLMARYPEKMDDAEKRTIQRIVWEVYYRYFEILLQQNIQEGMESVQAKQTEMTKDFTLKMRQKTEDEILGWLTKKIEESEIEKIRLEMQGSSK